VNGVLAGQVEGLSSQDKNKPDFVNIGVLAFVCFSLLLFSLVLSSTFSWLHNQESDSI
jgi:hypothetical protein